MNAYDVADIYDRWGLRVPKLGCVMLDVEQLPVVDYVPSEIGGYYSKNPDFDWISGFDVRSHITLLYGLIDNAHTIRREIDRVLQGWDSSDIWIDTLDSFESRIEGEPYSCIVGKVKGDSLAEAHARLSLLPHINTYPEYKPHVTLGYVYQAHRDAVIDALWAPFAYENLIPIGLNYGDEPDE